jgi:phage baseplate assembly protein W
MRSLKGINSTEAQIQKLGTAAGSTVSRAAYGAQVKALAAQEKAANKRADKIAAKIDDLERPC